MTQLAGKLLLTTVYDKCMQNWSSTTQQPPYPLFKRPEALELNIFRHETLFLINEG